MIKILFHQLWNQRSLNGWIFLELLVVSFFLWKVIDPIYVLMANRAIDQGYDARSSYVVDIGKYRDSMEEYNPAFNSDSINRSLYLHLVRMLRDLPEVEHFCLADYASLPNGRSSSTTIFRPDTLLVANGEPVKTRMYQYLNTQGSNLFETYGMKDALTGGGMVIPEGMTNELFVSAYLAERLYGTTDVVGKTVFRFEDDARIAGVFRDFKICDFEQPIPMVVQVEKTMPDLYTLISEYNLVIKLKEEVKPTAFETRFREEIVPQLTVGNFYLSKLTSFAEKGRQTAARNGHTNKLRLQFSLAGFAILCILLGMVGTFWVRCNARKQEVGVMRSMGASRTTICKQFLLEATLLVTVAFVLTLPALLHLAWVDGMYVVDNGERVLNPIYLQNRFGAHFLLVSFITYTMLLGIALIGTYIPVQRAVRILPADALRDE